MEKTNIERMGGKTVDEGEFKFPDDLNELREEIISNLNLCKNIYDINTVLEEYYGEVVGRMATGEI